MTKQELIDLINVASGKEPADLVIKNCQIVDVCNHKIINKNLAISGKYFAGFGDYESNNIIDAENNYIVPGFIDSHIHIESSYVSPEEMGRLLIPHGTSTIIADPHEIVNICGLNGLNYMINASKNTELDIKFMVPSCVPATPFETTGAIIDSKDIESVINQEDVLGLGEFMNYPGVINADNEVIEKLMVAIKNNKIIDGHSPNIFGNELNSYVCAGIKTDHECSTIQEMNDRLSRGMYVLLRQGSACHDLKNLVPAITEYNSRFCLLCSDDRHPKTIFEKGHLEEHLQICVEHGINPITAIQMATINAAQCYGLKDRGSITPGKVATFSIVKDFKSFYVKKMFLDGKLIANEHEFLNNVNKISIKNINSSIHVKNFTKEKLILQLKNNSAVTISLLQGGVLTKKQIKEVKINSKNEFIYDKTFDIVKVAVIERHKNTGNVALGLLHGYGMNKGAIAQSIAHDSHNIIAVGTNDDDIYLAVQELIKQQGGVISVLNGKILSKIPMPIAGLMSDEKGAVIKEKLNEFNNIAYRKLHVSKNFEPIMTLCFMSLAVIPEIKLTDKGLFDVTKFQYIDINTINSDI